MNLNEFHNLVDLFFHQADKQNPKSIFLEWLNTNSRKKISWHEAKLNIFKLTKILRKYLKNL